MQKINFISLNEEQNNTLKRMLGKQIEQLQRGVDVFKFDSNKPTIEILTQILNKLF